MPKKIKISIITVVYNGEDVVEKTLKSVLNQDYQCIEQIVVDGNSQDRTVNIIKKYDNFIAKWISETDDGLYQAMNKGVSLASGDYVYFLNAGDTLYNSQTISKLVKEVKDNRLPDMVYGKIVKVYEDYKVKLSRKFSIINLKNGSMPPHQGVFVQKKLFNKIGGFNERYVAVADLDFLCRLKKERITETFLNSFIAYVPAGGLSSDKSITIPEVQNVLEKHFGLFYALKFKFRKHLVEYKFKRILLKLGFKKIYQKLAKINNQLQAKKD